MTFILPGRVVKSVELRGWSCGTGKVYKLARQWMGRHQQVVENDISAQAVSSTIALVTLPDNVEFNGTLVG